MKNNNVIPWPGRQTPFKHDAQEPFVMEITPNPDLTLKLLYEVPVGVAVVDEEGKLIWCNEALASLALTTAGDVIGQEESSLFEKIRDNITDENTVYFPGSRRRVQRNGHIIDGFQIYFYQDVSERDAIAEQLRQRDTTEPVSGLLNERAISTGLEPLVSRSRRYDNPLSVVTMAITQQPSGQDEQKTILGVSQLLRDQMRWADLIGCLDNGHFALVLPETDKDSAVSLANKLAAQLADIGDEQQKLAVCFGITDWSRGDDARLLLQRSREALKTAMQKGNFSVEAA
jgi:GGDEF domain-containing protein